MPNFKTTHQDLLAMLEMRIAGKSNRDIARAYGLSHVGVMHALRRLNGIRRTVQKAKPKQPSEDSRVFENKKEKSESEKARIESLKVRWQQLLKKRK